MTLNVCPLREVIVYDINPQASQRYIKWVSDLKGAKSLSVKAAASVEEAVQGADLILTATSAKRPFLEFRWIDRARVICSLGSYQEITDEVGLRVDRRITDNKEQAKHRGNLAHLFESGRLKDADLHCEIGEVIAGRAQGRISDNQRVFYCPIGMGSEDVGVAYAALREGTKLNVGTMFNMECGLALL
jgi:ornithine cyclodeaminase/alanine dehydrogenase-like protein (mu-crystallin family)